MGQNVFALGFGTATLQAPPLVMDNPVDPAADRDPPEPVTNPQRPDPAPFSDRMTVM